MAKKEKTPKDKKESAPKGVKKDSEEVCELFEVGGDKEVKACGDVPKKHSTKEQIKAQNILLRNVIIGILFLFLVVVGTYFFMDQMRYFEYEEMKFDTIKEGNILFYHTSLPMYEGIKHVSNFNIYLRTHPKKIDQSVEMEGDLHLTEMMILDSTDAFVCDGDGAIATANMAQILKAVGTEVGTDPNATCDSQGRYMYVLLTEGKNTRIEQFGPACYNLYIHNCEILEVTERFALEALKKIPK